MKEATAPVSLTGAVAPDHHDGAVPAAVPVETAAGSDVPRAVHVWEHLVGEVGGVEQGGFWGGRDNEKEVRAGNRCKDWKHLQKYVFKGPRAQSHP